MEYRELSNFTEIIQRIASDEELYNLQFEIMKNPVKGKVVKGTNGAIKIRMALGNKGKRSGGRVIYYWQDINNCIWMLTAFLKKEKSDLTCKEKNEISDIIKEI